MGEKNRLRMQVKELSAIIDAISGRTRYYNTNARIGVNCFEFLEVHLCGQAHFFSDSGELLYSCEMHEIERPDVLKPDIYDGDATQTLNEATRHGPRASKPGSYESVVDKFTRPLTDAETADAPGLSIEKRLDQLELAMKTHGRAYRRLKDIVESGRKNADELIDKILSVPEPRDPGLALSELKGLLDELFHLASELKDIKRASIADMSMTGPDTDARDTDARDTGRPSEQDLLRNTQHTECHCGECESYRRGVRDKYEREKAEHAEDEASRHLPADQVEATE